MFLLFLSFRESLINDAIKFESWDFLEIIFSEDDTGILDALLAQAEKDEENWEWERIKAATLNETKLTALANNFPAFNEDALPKVSMEDVLNYGWVILFSEIIIIG